MSKVANALTIIGAFIAAVGLLAGGFDYFNIRDRLSKIEGKFDALTPQEVYSDFQKELEKLKEEAFNTRNSFTAPLPPIGSIIPYASKLEKLPPGWVFCRGQTISEEGGFSRNDVADGLWGKIIPNLQGRTLRGFSQGEEIGAQGGSDLLPDHNHIIDGLITGWISNQVLDPGARPYYVRDDNNPTANNNWLSTQNGRPQNEGHHRHELVGKTGGVTNLKTNYFPSYIAIDFIMRIK